MAVAPVTTAWNVLAGAAVQDNGCSGQGREMAGSADQSVPTARQTWINCPGQLDIRNRSKGTRQDE